MTSAATKEVNSKLASIEGILLNFGVPGKAALVSSQDIEDPSEKLDYLKEEARKIKDHILYYMKFKSKPVSIKTFIESPYYLNMKDVIYPKVMDELEELNSGKYIEAVLTGGIGTGKTTCALLTTAYQLYLLSLMRDPHKEFAIAPTDEIVFVFQSVSAGIAKSVDYARFKEMVNRSIYFHDEFPYDKNITSELRFPNRIIVKPISGEDTGAIGQNVFGGVLDEVNFMAVVEKSKQKRDGGTYDQAWENYRAIVRRRESRFMVKGEMPGMLCLVSSKQYPGEFTDVKIDEAKTNKRIFVYDKRQWDVKPESAFSDEWFYVFVGDTTRKPRILEDNEEVSSKDRPLVISVPTEFKASFEQDLLAALRDIAGVSTLALHPFILEIENVTKCFGVSNSVLSRPDCDFDKSTVQIYPKRILRPDQPRFVHLDLAQSSDSAGVACGYVSNFVKIQRGDIDYEILPEITYDFILEVEPPKNGEIQFHKIRSLLYKLRENGCNIRWCSMDTYQSTDTMQLLKQRGIMTGVYSLDVSDKKKPNAGYEIFKTALMDQRIVAPKHDKAYMEVIQLERTPDTNKVDHPPQGSKDCADAMAGVAYGLTMRREIWTNWGIPLSEVPSSITAAVDKGKNSIDNRSGQEALNGN